MRGPGALRVARRAAALAAAALLPAAPAAAQRAAAAAPAPAAHAAGRAPAGPAAAPATAPRAARALARGETLAVADVDGPGAERLVGWTTRRVIAAGEPLRAPAVAPPVAVKAGDPVALVYQAEGLTLRLKGTAAGAAPVGGRVPVRVDTRRRFEGVVVAPGVVRLP